MYDFFYWEGCVYKWKGFRAVLSQTGCPQRHKHSRATSCDLIPRFSLCKTCLFMAAQSKNINLDFGLQKVRFWNQILWTDETIRWSGLVIKLSNIWWKTNPAHHHKHAVPSVRPGRRLSGDDVILCCSNKTLKFTSIEMAMKSNI